MGSIDIDYTILIQLINFLIAVWVVSHLLIKPIREQIRSRHALMQGYTDGKGNTNTKMPTIPEFNNLYLQIKKNIDESELEKETGYCLVCDNKGYIPHTKIEEYETNSGKKVKISRDYIQIGRAHV